MKINIRLLFILSAFFVFYISYGQDSVMNNLVNHENGYQCMGKSMKCVKLTSYFDGLIDDCLRTRLPSYKFLKKWAKKNPDPTSYFNDSEWSADKASKLRELQKKIEGFKPGETDGRYFRDEFPHGYIGMLEYFGLWEEEGK
jgi:hypothetical protein